LRTRIPIGCIGAVRVHKAKLMTDAFALSMFYCLVKVAPALS
jgi:hypothetical protein